MNQAALGTGALMLAAVSLIGAQGAPVAKGVALSELAWPDAEPWLTASTVVVLPLGGGAVEQGRHMKLDADARLADYLASRVKRASPVVIAPTLTYHFYPAFADYPGSSSLGETTARDVTVDAVRSLARSGPRRFYVLNTAASTLAPLSAAAKTLGDAGILLGYTDPDYWTKSAPVLKQTRILVGHAEEAATSMMLFIDPSAVEMSRSTREYADGRGPLTRQENGRGVLSKSGTLGDATLATAQKGQVLVDALVAGILDDIEKVRTAPLPEARAAAPPPPPPSAPAVRRPAPQPLMPNGCSPADDRFVRNVGSKFSYYWAQLDPIGLSELFTAKGDIRHPDGSIETGRDIILQNRARLFARREYAGSKHPVQIADVRCLGTQAAIADGKWELRLQDEPQSTPGRGLNTVKTNSGFCTLILLKQEDEWLIEAWRYTINPPAGAPQPTLLSKPGYIGRGGG
jgi:creatinine amidohydrolase